jgi:hypothetical protein
MLRHVPVEDPTLPTSRTMKTYRMRKRTVTVVKKSQAATARARLREACGRLLLRHKVEA